MKRPIRFVTICVLTIIVIAGGIISEQGIKNTLFAAAGVVVPGVLINLISEYVKDIDAEAAQTERKEANAQRMVENQPREKWNAWVVVSNIVLCILVAIIIVILWCYTKETIKPISNIEHQVPTDSALTDSASIVPTESTMTPVSTIYPSIEDMINKGSTGFYSIGN